jgi:hypothetical protein
MPVRTRTGRGNGLPARPATSAQPGRETGEIVSLCGVIPPIVCHPCRLGLPGVTASIGAASVVSMSIRPSNGLV